MLQSKSLAGPEYNTTSKCQMYQDIKIIQEQARQVSKCFADLCKYERQNSRKLYSLIFVFQDPELSIKEWKTCDIHFCFEKWSAQIDKLKYRQKKSVNPYEWWAAWASRP